MHRWSVTTTARVLGALLVCLALALTGCSRTATHAAGPNGTPAVTDPWWPAGMPTVPVIALPADARHTLQLIDAGGPFPYSRDGVVYRNYEGLLPHQRPGYYHEYTVPTAGVSGRGARRIVIGAARETYYTNDHYLSFKAVIGR